MERRDSAKRKVAVQVIVHQLPPLHAAHLSTISIDAFWLGSYHHVAMPERYHVSDGSLLLTLEPDGDGWFVVTSPIDPAMITQARTIKEAFVQARDAFAALADSRSDPARWRSASGPAKRPARHRKVGAGT